jgi:hypothetical protein
MWPRLWGLSKDYMGLSHTPNSPAGKKTCRKHTRMYIIGKSLNKTLAVCTVIIIYCRARFFARENSFDTGDIFAQQPSHSREEK